nr:hypothetical protein [Tanacetum cinerariifolium]
PIIPNPEPCNNQTIDELPQALPIFHPTFHSEAESPFTLDSTPTYDDESPNVFNPPPQHPVYPCEFCGSNAQNGHYCTPQAQFNNLEQELKENLVAHSPDFQNTSALFNASTNVVNAPREPYVVKQDHGSFIDKIIFDLNRAPDSPNQFHCFHCKDVLRDGEACKRCTCAKCGSGLGKGLCYICGHNQNSLNDSDAHIGYNFPSKVPVISNQEPCNNQTIDELPQTLPIFHPTFHSEAESPFTLDSTPTYVDESPNVEKIVIPEDEEIEDDNLREKLLKVNILIAKIGALKDNPTSSFEFLTKSSSTSPTPFLEEINTFHNSLPEFENFCFGLEEISSGSTTTHSDICLPEYEAFSFYDDHIEEISSGSTTTQSDISLPEYDSFIFDLSNDQFTPTDGSNFTHEEFGDEPAHIISPPEYDCFYFGNLPDPDELTSSLNSGIRENLSSTTCVNLPVEDDYSPLLAYVVWIFLAYLTYPVIPHHLHLFGNEDTIFDPGITINRFYSFKPGLSHRCGTFKKFNTHQSHLNESPMEMLFSTLFPLDQT